MTKEEKNSRIAKWKARPLSWSQISSFEYEFEQSKPPMQWYNRYFLGLESKPSPEMVFGSKVGKRLETDPEYLPMIPREKHMEYEFKGLYKGRVLTGFADTFCDEKNILREYKTGVKEWDQERVDKHGQITFYCFMKYFTEGIKPEDVTCSLHWMPTMRTEKGDFTVEIKFVKNIEKEIKHFETKRTLKEVLKFGTRIDKNILAMEKFIETYEP